MCGILGQIKINSDISLDTVRFKRALDLLTHRGPDDSDIFVDKRFMFGHKRLSIIDLSSAAKQPMLTNDKQVIIVFNGEIYNYKELRESLIEKGYLFRTSSDTEVLLNGYHCFGIEFIYKCIGMFAFAIYDKRYNTAFLVRDRLGIKPLYYCIKNGRITFSSEVKAIFAFEDLNKELNMKAVSSYFSFRYPIFNDTFFVGIYSIPPGHYMKIKNNKFYTERYWNLADKYIEQEEDKGESFYINKLKELLSSSVKYRMISDVPVGSFLSGGIDSSIITAIMSKETNSAVETFTIGYKEEGYNEFDYAGMITKRYKTNHHEIHTDCGAYLENLERLIRYKDAPLSIPNEVTHYEMTSELRKNVTVVLAGTGADEIFYGYGRIFRSTYDYERLKRPESLRDKNLFMLNFKAKYGKTYFKDELDHFMDIYPYVDSETKKNLLHKSIDIDRTEEKIRAKFQTCFDEIRTGKYLDKAGYSFLKIHLPGILGHNDIISMASSVELRVPFLDHRLVEFALSVPVHYKLRWNSDKHKMESDHLMSDEISEVYDKPKYLLKQAYKNDIPKEIYYRKKIGFPVPLHFWFGGEYRTYASDLLLNDKAKKRDIYNTDTLKEWFEMKDLKEHKGDSRTYQYSMAGKIWMLVNLELFFRAYFD